MNEAFLSYLWMYRLLGSTRPALVDGRECAIVSPGTLNRDAGPDFLGARFRLDDALWVGNVEIHVKSSDWYLHRHHEDEAYRTVILHVVFEHDREVMQQDGTAIPVVELKGALCPTLYTRYLQFMASANEIPCAALIKGAEIPIYTQWLVSLGMQRLIRKGEGLDHLFNRLGSDWRSLLFVSFCRSFGQKINDDIFEMLALRIPLSLVEKCGADRLVLEALLFGQAGLLSAAREAGSCDYLSGLNQEYQRLNYQYDLEPMEPHLWRFLRTRPANFPTVRMAQLAALMESFLATNMLQEGGLLEWREEALRCTISAYWQHHYHFGKRGVRLPHQMGPESVDRIIVNGLMPPLLRYGSLYKAHGFVESLMDLAGQLKPEEHRIIRLWHNLGIRCGSALESQGLTELFGEYCRQKRCLDCRIGHQLLSKAYV
jgi:hypothetical protein